ncbi:MAG TPA: HlyD family secretion protein [Stellaceae bacterium]|nr:HlyD family secretion protein [Stellaceae bacterium]
MTSMTDTLRDRLRPAKLGWRGLLRTRWLRLMLMLALPIAVVIAGTGWYLTSGRYVSTDDAYVQADTVAVSSDVAGRVVGIDVKDNQHVTAGQVLIRLDQRPFRAAAEQAKAQLASARLQVEGLRASYKQRQAELASAQDTLNYQQREFDRQQKLLSTGVTSQANFDQARNRLATARQQVASVQQQLAAVLASLGGNPDIATDDHPMVQQAQAQLDQAELNLSYTVIKAPADGVVTNVNKLPVGTFLNAAMPAFSLVETDRPWIEANYKETELTHMKAGDAATVTVDAYPGATFKARVASLSPGTGSVFSVLPPQNATGNWVKVVQRLPVRIEVDNPDPNQPLRAGMSVTAEVDTGYRHHIVAAIESFFGVGGATR